MSGKFSGFTDDDIKKVQNNLPPTIYVTNTESVPRSKKSQKVVIRVDSARHKILESKTANDAQADISEEAKLSKPAESLSQQRKSRENDNITETQLEQMTTIEEAKTSEEITTIEQKKTVVDTVIQNSSDGDVEKRFIDLDEFQARQKAIEEQNNRRKQLLAKALADRTKRTQEEAKRLNEIQEEFKKLDAVLSNDVKILRHKIELASVDYMETQKRYLRIEKVFLSAKLQLQKQLEKKEMLTEHLCTIIEQNEERKAEKLTELIKKLNLDENNKDEENNKTT